MAKGSQTGWFGLAPEKRVCAGCGDRLTLKMTLCHDEAGGRAWHFECWLRSLRAA